jgi:hypothetical protein
MTEFHLKEEDRAQLEDSGITEAQVRRQLEIFKKPQFNVHLVRNCMIGDGIIKIEPEHAKYYEHLQREAAQQGRFLKFIPASGAATRMFKFLFQVQQENEVISWETIKQGVNRGVTACEKFKRFMENLTRFAFHNELKEIMAGEGLDLDQLVKDGQFQPVLQYLLSAQGLSYGSMAKGLLKFHRYPAGSRTAFEEHLVEAAQYVRDADGVCRLHLTILPEHEERFKSLLENVREFYERLYGVQFKVDFSFQESSTDTIAVDLKNNPVRDQDGRLVFRPGGHGALLQNLNKLQDHFVYIKNIDNVVPDCLKEATCFWKRVLGGLLVELEASIHDHVRRLKTEATAAMQKKAEEFARERLWIDFPGGYRDWPASKQHSFLLTKLNRPIRVCGVVRNVGEPGGAPFWVEDPDGTASMQIVEKAQVNFNSSSQKAIWSSSTHFNPVDLVCSMKDYAGKPFDLRRYINPDAVFISTKSMGGHELKALELPGLWNGSMADWNTLCVDTPIITFNPVKTVDDLLRPEHQQK